MSILLHLFFGASWGLASQLPLSMERGGEPEIFQREYIVAYSNQYGFVQSYGANTCVILALHSPYERKGYLAHIDAQTDIDRELERIGREFRWDMVTISILGGVRGDGTRLFEKIRSKVLALGGKISIEYQNASRAEALNIRMNLETGDISRYEERFASTSYQVALAKRERLRFGRRLFRHEGSVGGGDPVDISNNYAPRF